MAYVDKLTTMRRFVLLHPNGNIAAEGVELEGGVTVKWVDDNLPDTGHELKVVVIDEDEEIEPRLILPAQIGTAADASKLNFKTQGTPIEEKP